MKQSTFHFGKEAAFVFPNSKGTSLFWDLVDAYDKKYLNDRNPFAKKGMKKLDDAFGKTYDIVKGTLAAGGTIAGGVLGGHIINQNVGYYAERNIKKAPKIIETYKDRIESIVDKYNLPDAISKQFKELLNITRSYIKKYGDNIYVIRFVNRKREAIAGYNIKGKYTLIKDDLEKFTKKLVELDEITANLYK